MLLGGAPDVITRSMVSPIVNPLNAFPGVGKFEAAYAWPLIPAGQFRIQSAPAIGATNPKKVIDVNEVHALNASFPILVMPLPSTIEVKEVE